MSDIISVKALKRIVVTLAAGGAIGFCLLLLVYAIPTARMVKNAAASIEIFEKEGIYPQTVPGYRATTLDNYTDAWMIRNAIYSGEEPLLARCLNVYFYGYTHEETNDVCESLIAYLRGMEGYERISYNEYWHGYLVFLKPLLYFLDYGDIRQILKIVAFTLVVAVCILMERRRLSRYLPAFIAAMACVEFSTVGMSMQYASVFIIALSFSIFLLRKYPETIHDAGTGIVFLVIGMCTSYFDFLTYPVFTLGIPLLVWAFLANETGQKENLPVRMPILAFCHCVHWAVGYAGMWSLKWIIYSVLLGKNLVAVGIQSVLYRSGRDVMGERIGYLETLSENISALAKYPYVLACIAALVFLMLACKKEKRKASWQVLLTYLFIAALPLLWYAASMNHSYIHAHMTYKDLSVSVFAGLCAMTEMKNLIKRRT